MHIISIRPETTGGNTLARFDVQLTPDIRMFGMKLVATARGHRVYPPHTSTHNCATFAPAFAESMICAALAALAGENLDRSNAA
ncbi:MULTISPECIES: hypothetical protein [Rhizobium]|uniref:hypothetical protein n=1 Tax=Rhizobium TaxID=379 RepID=UPI0004091BAB|nr:MULTISPECIES: hypothetical protein [Rhizobium]KPN22654.1 hypothetical protein KS05_32365 [Rhizobium brockwellii]QJS27176.1 hypothetical protein RLTA1_07635 [Rhizobium leguminosarum bv. trifolii TA1]QJX04747.1 hypothetical protein RLCC275e_07200 [Rhizobium brockwellii]UFW95916.1 hypothetical protein RlegTA1_07610 [Rhizobium ruizarguesonis]